MSGDPKQPGIFHGLTLDAKKRRYKCRVTIQRHKKFVGARIMVHLPTTDPGTAIFARDAILNFCEKIGLCVIRRAQVRQQDRNSNEQQEG